MKRILLIANSFEEQEKLEDIVQHHSPGGFVFETTASFGQDAVYWLSQPPEVVVIELPDDDMLQVYYLNKLRSVVPKTQRIIILCPNVSGALIKLSQEFQRIRLMKAPVDSFMLYRALLDFTKTYEPGKQQLQPRYLTDQRVEVTSDWKQGKTEGRMKNLSLSGAYIEVSSLGFEMVPKDFIKLSIFAPTSAKFFVFDAKVVWSKSLPQGGHGFGVMFTNSEDVYNNLLKGI